VGPFFILFKTKKINKLIGSLAHRWPRAWKIVWNLGIVISFLVMGYAFYFLGENLVKLLFRSSQAAPLVPIIPGITITGITLLYFIFPFFIAIIVHEFSHGIAAKADDVPVKSSGGFFAVIFPGAFVELEEDKLKKSERKTKLRIFAAGSFSNMIIAILALILISNFAIFGALLFPLYGTQRGVLIQQIVPNGPLDGKISPPFAIFGITDLNNSVSVEFEQYSSISNFIEKFGTDLTNFIDQISPGDTLAIDTNVGVITIVAGTHPDNSSRAFIGIVTSWSSIFPFFEPRFSYDSISMTLPYHLYQVILWTHIISLSLGMFNLLPIPPFDGDKLLTEAITSILPKDMKTKLGAREIHITKLIINIIRISAIVLLVANLALSFIIFPIFSL